MPSARDYDRVRRSYDAVAQEYAVRLGNELAGKALDRALLAVLIEQTEHGTPIADLGCGPGHVAAWLADHDVPVVGIDLSLGMIFDPTTDACPVPAAPVSVVASPRFTG